MAAPTNTFIDPLAGATNGSDHGGAGFVDGTFANAGNILTKIAAFPAVTCQAGDKIYLRDNGSSEVTPGLYTISVRTDNDNVVLTADIRSGANDPTDVRCDLHDGTINLAWATNRHALNFTTQGVSGDQMNTRDTAPDVLIEALDLTAYGNPTLAAPLIFRGYTTAANDGGIGELDANGGDSVFDDNTESNLSFVDLHMHNCGSDHIIRANNYVRIINCELNNTSGYGFIVGDYCIVAHSNFHDIGGYGIFAGETAYILFNTFENGTKTFQIAVDVNLRSFIAFNVLVLGGVSDGINLSSWGTAVLNNSIYSAGAATGQGIKAGAQVLTTILNNLVEGFSGVGGIGIETTGGSLSLYGYNQVYDCTTEYSIAGEVFVSLGNNETLLASPFTNPGGGDFTPVAAILGEGWPDAFSGINTNNYLDPGAAQAEAGAGGGLAAPLFAPSGIVR